jgi:hypothetical protein
MPVPLLAKLMSALQVGVVCPVALTSAFDLQALKMIRKAIIEMKLYLK